jgi:hypothetical protein
MKPGRIGSLSYKDAVFISPHKFIGGPGTPGVLVIRSALVKNTVPTQPGGGTVDFVTKDTTRYSDSIPHREEAGTPAILESIRCGLVFQLKDRVGADTIHHHETALVRQAIASFRKNPNIRILGNPEADRLSIVSFMIRHGGRYLHHNYVIAVLNDLFGLQARGGCSCAGPYGATLLGIKDDLIGNFLKLIELGWAALKPGWARVNFNYFISEKEFQYILSAIHLLAASGYALLPSYALDPRDALWRHRGQKQRELTSLTALRIDGGDVTWKGHRDSLPESALDEHLDQAQRILSDAQHGTPAELPAPELDESFERMRWFPLPHEIASYLRHRNSHAETSVVAAKSEN